MSDEWKPPPIGEEGVPVSKMSSSGKPAEDYKMVDFSALPFLDSSEDGSDTEPAKRLEREETLEL
jgi:hypothetical protein